MNLAQDKAKAKRYLIAVYEQAKNGSQYNKAAGMYPEVSAMLDEIEDGFAGSATAFMQRFDGLCVRLRRLGE